MSPIPASIMQDLRYSFRALLKSPGLLLVMVGSLALGIGANTAIFSVVRALLIDPLPYKDADRLVMLWEDWSKIGFPENTPAPANYADWKARNTVFSSMAASRNRAVNLTGSGEPQRLEGRGVTWDWFGVLGVAPILGRTFTADEDMPGANKTAVIGHSLWIERFGGAKDVIGRKVLLDNEPHTVIGVMPAGFDYPQKRTVVWTPIAFSADDLQNRKTHFLQIVARIKPGVTFEAARENMRVIGASLAREYPEDNPDVAVRVKKLRDQLLGKTGTAVLLMLLMAGCVLLIASANVANLMLVRSVARQKELALRLAMGAGRWRLTRQLLTESLLVAGLGVALGVAVANIGLRSLQVVIPKDLTSVQLTLDSGLLAFAATIGLLSAALFGLMPARIAWRLGLAQAIQQSGVRSGEPSGARLLRGGFVMAQTAFAVLLLVAAGLILQTFEHLRSIDPGFRGEQVLTMRTALSPARYKDAAAREGFYAEVLRRIRGLPGVSAAGFTSYLPYVNAGGSRNLVVEGKPLRNSGEEYDANYRLVTPDYLTAMGMRISAGRTLNQADNRAETETVAVVNEVMARSFWPGESALNRRFQLCPNGHCTWFRVVGIARDIHQKSLDTEARPEYFAPHLHFPVEMRAAPQDLAIRTAGDPLALVAAVRRAIWDVDPQQPIAQVKVMDEYLQEDLAPRRFQSQLLGGFAALALLLAAMGLYGVLSYSVAQRRREMGVRAALGAQARDLLRLVIGQGVRPALIGLGIGLVTAYALATFIAGLLYGVEARDPLTFLLAAAVLIGTAGLSCWLPARRAASVEPMEALRIE